MSTVAKIKQRFKVGDWVSFPWGSGKLVSQVIEERGPLGVHGRHIYRIRYALESVEPDSFEMPDDELDPMPPPERRAIINYLKQGGLVAILQANLCGGRNPPRVWLTYTPRGELAHTFDDKRGLLGGAAVPFFALHEHRVFVGKTDEVIAFLTSFGLSKREGEEVVAAVGAGP